MANILKERGERVEDAFRLLQGNKDSLGNIPGILRQLVSLRVWEGYEWRGKTITFETFREFIETPPPDGLGTTVEELISFCRKYPEVADLLDQVVQEQALVYRPRARAHASKRPSGNSYQRSIRRLRTLASYDPKAKKLYERFLQSEITASYALKELGKRKSRYGVEASAESVVQFIKRHLSKPERNKVIKALEKG